MHQPSLSVSVRRPWPPVRPGRSALPLCGRFAWWLAIWLLVPQGSVFASEALREVAAEVGLDFIHRSGASGNLLLPEITGSGVGVFDADGDGDLDLYLVQSGQLLGPDGKSLLPAKLRQERDQLYRNDGVRTETGSGQVLRFTDVSAQAGALSSGYGMGVTAGDFDNDGLVDLYVTNLGANQLLRNLGGRFEDVTAKAGVGDAGWGVSAAFVDADRDGWLDLFVGNYAVWDAADKVECFAPSSRPDYCGPLSYQPQADVFYRNRGDGTFESLHAAQLRAVAGAALGVVASDLDTDGWQEILVANDGTANHLWSLREGGFEEIGLFAGVAVNRSGRPEASMGIDLADYDNDGDDDLFLTHLDGETNTLLHADGKGNFADSTSTSGLGPDSFPSTAFGTGSLDFDGDGLLDLVVLNGAVRVDPLTGQAGIAGLGQANRIYRGLGAARFAAVSAADVPPVFSSREISRGAAFGDLDQDGDVDVVYTNNDGPARLLLNGSNPRRWWGLDVRIHGRPALGARVAVVARPSPGRADAEALERGEQPFAERVVWRRVRADGSYASANDPRVVVSEAELGGTPGEIRVVYPGAPQLKVPGERLVLGTYTKIELPAGSE